MFEPQYTIPIAQLKDLLKIRRLGSEAAGQGEGSSRQYGLLP